jgi:O-antigen/teichoic acid export membrane protein
VSASIGRPRVVRAGLLSMVGLVALGLTRLVHISLVGRATDKATVALVGTLIGVATTAGLFLPGGLASAASKFIPFHRGKGDSGTAWAVHRLLSWSGIVTAVALGTIVGAGTGVLLDLSPADTAAVSVLTAVFSVYSIEKGALYGFDRVAPYARLEIAGSVVAIGSTVVVVTVGGHAYLAPLILGYSVLIVGAWVLLRRRITNPSVRVSRPARREITEFVLLASAGGLASAGLLQLLPLLARWFTTEDEVSYFVTGVALVAPLYFLPRALGMALFPAMAHAHGSGDTDAVRRHADLSTRALLVVLAPLFAAAIPLAREALVLLIGSEYAAGALVLQLLLVATYLAVIQVAAVNALSSGTPREVRIPVFSAVAGALLGLLLLVPLGLWLGGTGVGLGYLIATGAGAAGPIVATWRRYRMSWAGPLIRALVVLTVGLAAGLAVEAAGASGTGRVLLDIGLAVGVAGVGAAVLYRDLRAIVTAASFSRSSSGSSSRGS